jgi:hypothetical protein
MIKWVVGMMRNVKITIETASLHGWEYNPANQLHHKKPGASMMHRDLTEQVGGGGKNLLPHRSLLCVTFVAAIIQRIQGFSRH